MRHTRGLSDLVTVKLLIATIAIGVHHAAEASEVVGRMCPLAVRAIIVGDGPGRWILIATAIEDVDPNPSGFRLSPPRGDAGVPGV